MIEDTLTVELPDGRTISVPPVPDVPGCAGSGDGWEALQLIVRSLADRHRDVLHLEGFATSRTSAWTLSNDKPEPASLPFRRTFARAATRGGQVK